MNLHIIFPLEEKLEADSTQGAGREANQIST